MGKLTVLILIILSLIMMFNDNKKQLETQNYQETVANDNKIKLEKLNYHGTVAKAKVNADNLNIRLKPTVNSLKVGKLNKGDEVTIKGYSDYKDTIDDFEGYWLKINVERNDLIEEYASDDYNYSWYGWVFSKYIDIDPAIEVSKISVKKFYPGEKFATVDLEIDRKGEKSISNVYATKFKNQQSYYFSWSDYEKDFMFCDPVGTYKFNPETYEITHITDMGGWFDESAGCYISDDDKYFFKDYGTRPGVRGLVIYDIETNKFLFKGQHFGLEYDGNSIVVVEKKNRYGESYCSQETLERSEEYEQTLQPGDLESRSIVVRYKLNLDDFSTEFLDCTTVFEQ